MNGHTIACVGALYPSKHVFNVAASTAAQLATTAYMFRFTNTGSAVASVNIPLGTEKLGSGFPFDPEINGALTGSRVDIGRSRSGRPYFNSTSFDSGRPFLVRAVISGAGAADNGGGGSSLICTLYQGVSATASSNTALASTGAAFNMTDSKNFAFNAVVEARLSWDSVSGALGGIYSSYLNANKDTSGSTSTKQAVAPATTLNVVNATLAQLQFSVGVTVSVAALLSGSVSLQELSVEQV